MKPRLSLASSVLTPTTGGNLLKYASISPQWEGTASSTPRPAGTQGLSPGQRSGGTAGRLGHRTNTGRPAHASLAPEVKALLFRRSPRTVGGNHGLWRRVLSRLLRNLAGISGYSVKGSLGCQQLFTGVNNGAAAEGGPPQGRLRKTRKKTTRFEAFRTRRDRRNKSINKDIKEERHKNTKSEGPPEPTATLQAPSQKYKNNI